MAHWVSARHTFELEPQQRTATWTELSMRSPPSVDTLSLTADGEDELSTFALTGSVPPRLMSPSAVGEPNPGVASRTHPASDWLKVTVYWPTPVRVVLTTPRP